MQRLYNLCGLLVHYLILHVGEQYCKNILLPIRSVSCKSIPLFVTEFREKKNNNVRESWWWLLALSTLLLNVGQLLHHHLQTLTGEREPVFGRVLSLPLFMQSSWISVVYHLHRNFFVFFCMIHNSVLVDIFISVL